MNSNTGNVQALSRDYLAMLYSGDGEESDAGEDVGDFRAPEVALAGEGILREDVGLAIGIEAALARNKNSLDGLSHPASVGNENRLPP